ncbi:hypothetical protein DICSQDRAFT_70917, partial [Dichomitus squalens LYAD-421 SS1]
EDLITVSSDIDVRVRQCCAERERQRGRTTTTTTATKPAVPLHTTPFTPPARDPNAMDINATRTREEFNRLMRGKCYSCGSTVHVKKDGGHDRDICSYCRRVGHRETVCMDKFLKKPRSQKLAATEEGPEELQVAASMSTSADAGATNALIAQLME